MGWRKEVDERLRSIELQAEGQARGLEILTAGHRDLQNTIHVLEQRSGRNTDRLSSMQNAIHALEQRVTKESQALHQEIAEVAEIASKGQPEFASNLWGLKRDVDNHARAIDHALNGCRAMREELNRHAWVLGSPADSPAGTPTWAQILERARVEVEEEEASLPGAGKAANSTQLRPVKMVEGESAAAPTQLPSSVYIAQEETIAKQSERIGQLEGQLKERDILIAQLQRDLEGMQAADKIQRCNISSSMKIIDTQSETIEKLKEASEIRRETVDAQEKLINEQQRDLDAVHADLAKAHSQIRTLGGPPGGLTYSEMRSMLENQARELADLRARPGAGTGESLRLLSEYLSENHTDELAEASAGVPIGKQAIAFMEGQRESIMNLVDAARSLRNDLDGAKRDMEVMGGNKLLSFMQEHGDKLGLLPGDDKYEGAVRIIKGWLHMNGGA